MRSSAESLPAWRVVPTVLLRHAGYPVDDLEPLADASLAVTVTGLLDSWRSARAAAAALKAALRSAAAVDIGPVAGAVAGAVGMLRPLPSGCTEALDAVPPPVVDGYRASLAALERRMARVQEAHRTALTASRKHVAELFDEPSRQQVLLLSNPAVFEQFNAWRTSGRRSGGSARKLTDLLVMYLQRIATKNETNSHFGPFAIGTIDEQAAGVEWSDHQGARRKAFLSHWAASRLLRASLRGVAADVLRPRQEPLAFPSATGVHRYAYVDSPDLPHPWQLTGPGRPELEPGARWLLDLVDGARSVGDLREHWSAHEQPGEFDEAFASLVAEHVVDCEPTLPSGDAETVGRLRNELALYGQDTALADDVERLLTEFECADHPRRAGTLGELQRTFQAVSSSAPRRGLGEHYADRDLLFEDCLSRVHPFSIGRGLERFISDELTDAYDSLLLGARLRMCREREGLARWLGEAFGEGRETPLGDVYERFLADREVIARFCDSVDADIGRAERELADDLLRHWDGHAPQADVPKGLVRELLSAQPAGPAAVCNPDIMLGAASADDLRAGEFFGVIGDCHAVRDLLTHGPYAPFLEAGDTDTVRHVLRGYRRIVDADEVLVDVVRPHTSKVCAQLELPVPHLEVGGTSPKPRGQVLLPRDLTLVARDGQPELRSPRFEGRLRLLASVSGAASIRHDPTAVFAFPRSLGGGLLQSVDEPYLPRIRSGRVVLSRRRWRLPAAEIDDWQPPRRWDSVDAREFVSAALLRERLDLPRHVFVKVPHEPKPLYVDLTAPLLVRQFHRAVRKTAPNGIVDISEMLPAPDQLWLRIDGRSHTAELRCTVFSR